MPTDGHSGFLKTGGSHIGAGRLFWYWGKAQRRVRAAQVQTNSKRAARQCEPRRLFAPRKALCVFRKKACPWVFSPTRPEGDWGRAESPQCARRRKPLPRRGMTRRLRRGKRACSPMGRSIASVGDPKGVQGGNVGKRVSSGHNRRRRLATRSSGKQQAERTAVRAAPIVCPEESPLLAPQSDSLVGA